MVENSAVGDALDDEEVIERKIAITVKPYKDKDK